MSKVLKCPVLDSAPRQPRFVLENRKLQMDALGLNTFLNWSEATVWFESGLLVDDPTVGEASLVPTRRSHTLMVLSFEVVHEAI